MGFKFDEKALINNNIFKYEDKLNSQYTRFLDQTPTYVTYYNINSIETTVDLGFSNVEKILGNGSPIKYSEVKNLPVYGMEQIQLQLDEDEEGLNSSFDAELIILPDTIQPYPDDFFIIEHKGFEFLFRVTNVEYDTIKSNNFFKIQFTVKYVTPEESVKILKQVTEKYTCVVENIGTQDRCIIEDDEYALLLQMKALYKEISERYKLFFYRKKYNAFVYIDPCDLKMGIYDRYLNTFIQKHGLLYDTESHRTIYLNNEDDSCCYMLEYDMSIYRIFELRRKNRVILPMYRLGDITNIYSVFKYYNANVKSVRFANGDKPYLPQDVVMSMVSGVIPEEPENDTVNMPYIFDEADKMIVKYMNDQIESIYNIDFEALIDFNYFTPTWFNFVKIPLLLYVMKGYYNLFIKKQLSK